MMSEQQSIISGLRDLARSPDSMATVLSSDTFQALVYRLTAVQGQQRALFEQGRVGTDEQRLLVKQNRTMMDLLARLTEKPPAHLDAPRFAEQPQQELSRESVPPSAPPVLIDLV